MKLALIALNLCVAHSVEEEKSLLADPCAVDGERSASLLFAKCG